MKYCMNCGQKLNEGDKFCLNCGEKTGENVAAINNNSTTQENVIPQQQVNVNNNVNNTTTSNDNANLLCILSLILGFGSDIIMALLYMIFPSLSTIIQGIAALCPTSGLVLMIIARIKYPQSKFAKIVMWIYIVSIGLAMLLLIAVMVACAVVCSTTDTSGCN